MSEDTDFEIKSNKISEKERAKNQAEQLDVLVGDTKPNVIEVTDLNGVTTEFPVEQFSNYKTAQVLKMLASVKDKVNLATLLSEILALAKRDEPQPACPHCHNDGVLTLFDAKRDSIFENDDGRVGCSVCARPYYLKDAYQYISDTDKATKLNAALEAVPALMEFAPDLLIEFSALALISNADLKSAFTKPNGISKLLADKEMWLRFDCAPNIPLRILIASIPFLGLGNVISELNRLDTSATQLLTSL